MITALSMETSSGDPATAAAALAFAILRFGQVAAHSPSMFEEEGHGVPGKDFIVFVPSWRRTTRDEVIPFLAALRSPAMLFCTTWRGCVVPILLDELTGARRAGAQKTFDNNRGGLESIVRREGLTDDSPIVLEFDDEEHVFPLAVLREYFQRFVPDVGWSLGRCEGHDRGIARLDLVRVAGGPCWGGSCSVRSTLTDDQLRHLLAD